MGANTTKKYFYLPALGASGQSELDLYNAAQERADSQLPIFPQAYATGSGTEGDPWAGTCLNDALTACPAGGTIYMRAGYYQLNVVVDVDSKSVNFIGDGIGKTIIKTADLTGFIICLIMVGLIKQNLVLLKMRIKEMIFYGCKYD